MTDWTVQLTDAPATEIACDSLILAVGPGPESPLVLEPSLSKEVRARLNQWVSSLGIKAKPDDAHRIPAPEGVAAATIVLVGLESDTPSVHDIRYAAGVGARAAGEQQRIAVSLPQAGPLHTAAALEGALLGTHRAGKPPRSKESSSEEKTLTIRGALGEEDRQRALATAGAVTWVRELVTTPPNALYPETLVEQVRSACMGLPIDIEVWDEDRLATEGFGGLLGVGSGSIRPPRLVAMRYRPDSASAHVALVGKGITFDSGGLSLKQPGSMVGMKYDMTGAATVAGATIAAAQLGVSVAVTGWLCLAENMPSGSALRPNDVLTIRGGKTVEVLNTDAEGRLVLADGLVRASEDRPDLIVDVATLTGAARIALGERYAGLMGHERAVAAVSQAASGAGELVWPMPLPQELRTLLDSDVADIANVKPGNTFGGMLIAGLFLREFVGRVDDAEESPLIPWAHLDIAGPASNSSAPWGSTPKGATGALTRTLIHLLAQAETHMSDIRGQ